MDAEQMSVAKGCLSGSHDGSMSFPTIIATLIAAGFDGYAVDYRAGTSSYYLPDGEAVVIEMPRSPGPVAAGFNAEGVEAMIRWAQSEEPNYTYTAFCEKVKEMGCAGYIVSFLGRRVVYYGRTGETHVEMFPR